MRRHEAWPKGSRLRGSVHWRWPHSRPDHISLHQSRAGRCHHSWSDQWRSGELGLGWGSTRHSRELGGWGVLRWGVLRLLGFRGLSCSVLGKPTP